jgi:VWFA-related protein
MRLGMRVSLVLFVCGVIVAPLSGQPTPSTPAYGEALEVRLYNLDAVVTDRDGKPVRGLTKDDFLVRENNVAQEISNFSFYDMASPTMTLAPGENGELVTTSVETPASVGTAPPPRRFIFFIDEMAIQARARNTLKKQAATLLAVMRPGDLAAVVRPTSTVQMEQKYTSDQNEIGNWLNKAIDTCKITLTAPQFAELRYFRKALETAEAPGEIARAKQEYVEQQRTRVQQRIGQLRALIASLAGADEKKVLVLITSGLNAQPGREIYSTDEQLQMTELHQMKDPEALLRETRGGLPINPDGMWDDVRALGMGKLAAKSVNQRHGWDSTHRNAINDLQADIDDLGRTAAAQGIVIYSLTPEIPLFLDSGRGADARSSPGTSTITGDNVHLSARAVVPQEMLNQLLTYEGETLQSLSDKTGGRWFRGTAVIDDTFRTLFDDLQVYYSLAYRGRGEENKARRIQVTVKGHPELKVRTRSEVIDQSGSDMASRVIAGLLYPRGVDELKMAVKTETPQKEGKQYNVPLEVVIPIDKITFLRASDGTYHGRVAVHYAAAGEREFISYGRQEQLIELTPVQYRDMLRIRYRYTSNITVPKGKIRIALGVVDSTSKMSSLQTVNVIAQ